MTASDGLRLALRVVVRSPLRSSLVLFAMAIGVAAIVVLSSLGEAARRYVAGEFASLGIHLLIVFPGRSETTGGSPVLFGGETPRDLTLADALALTRSRAVYRVAPLVLGAAPASFGDLEREVPVLGSTHELLELRHWKTAQGTFLPPGDPERAQNVCVLGVKVRRELFGPKPALGEWIRLGDRRFRVIGIMATEGRSIGLDVQELVIIPVAAAQALLNVPSLLRILVEAKSREALPAAQRDITAILQERHQGEKDVTVVTQDAVLATFDRVLRALTYAVAGIAAISLAVAGILIMNVMLVTVTQRTPEIGLLKALGAPRREILALFLAEATVLSLVGATVGLVLGFGASTAIGRLYPILPVATPLWAVAGGLAISLLTGLCFGVMPARRAARLDAVQALSRR